MIRFKSFSSGSCGNCYFLGSFAEDGSCSHGVVIDTGVSLRRMKKELERESLGTGAFSAILVTHDHMDHVRSLGSWCKHLKKPVWATYTLHGALIHNYMVHPWINDCRRVLKEDDWNEIIPGHVSVRPFIVPHDATQTCGYAIVIDGYRFVIMTDIGRMTPEALSYAYNAGTVVVESNYDPDMLIHGSYPYLLKRRIMDGNGHLSNPECAEAIKQFMHPGLRHIFLCHLSEHNNTPELALESARGALSEWLEAHPLPDPSLAPWIVALPRETPSQLFTLD